MEKLTEKHTNRCEIVDIAKGLGITLVVLGHCVPGGAVHQWIYSYHMALFFFLSGLFLRRSTIKNTVLKKAKTLLVPYFAFCVFGLIISVMVPSWRTDLLISTLWKKSIYTAYPEVIHLTSIWFLVSLFWISIVSQLLLRIEKKYMWICAVSCFAFEIIITKLGIKSIFLYGELPLKFDSVLAFLLIFMLGFAFKEKILKWEIPFLQSNVVLIVSFICSLILSRLNGEIYASIGQVNNPGLFILESCAGIIFIVSLSALILRMKLIKNVFLWFGKNSLYILGFQAIFYRLSVLIINVIVEADYQINGLPAILSLVSFVSTTMISALCTYGIIKLKGIQNKTYEK